MIRLFNVYYSKRTLILLAFEVVLVSGSFILAAAYLMGPDTDIALLYENGLLKIAAITSLTLLLTYYFDLYEPRRIAENWEIYFRLLLVLSVLSFILAALIYLSPGFDSAAMSSWLAFRFSPLFSCSGAGPMNGSSASPYSANAYMCWVPGASSNHSRCRQLQPRRRNGSGWMDCRGRC